MIQNDAAILSMTLSMNSHVEPMHGPLLSLMPAHVSQSAGEDDSAESRTKTVALHLDSLMMTQARIRADAADEEAEVAAVAEVDVAAVMDLETQDEEMARMTCLMS